MRDYKIAELCHEVNKAYCESIDDFSQTSWVDAPEWQRDSAINGVKFHLNNENIKPEDSHNSWMKQKIEEGWVYGEVKDPEKKTHPCMVKYNQLPVEQRSKDYIFKAICDFFKKHGNTRACEVFVNDEWVKINPIDIKQGMKFKMFELDGTPIVGLNNQTEFVALDDASYDEDGVIGVQTD